ncbi:MAG: hypothetical protein ACKO0Z_16290 [Betaproteobacteria bacterium]
MPWPMNPWLLLAALLAILGSFIGGLSAGKDIERSAWMEREMLHQKTVDQETSRANGVAILYGNALNESQETATKLRRQLNESRKILSDCSSGNARLNAEFVRLRDAAMQSAAADPGKPASATNGAGIDPADLIDIDIENGRRWKACRGQLNALIDILGDSK